MTAFRLLSIVFLGIVLSSASGAQGVDIWFGDSSANPITSVNVAQGSTFTVSLWYQTGDSWAHNAIELLVGFDRASSIGTGATPLDGKLTLVGVSGISFPIVLVNNVGGGYSPTSGDRPYGVHLALGMALGMTATAVSPVKIADVSLRNQGIAPGGHYDVTIWNLGQGERWTSFAPMMSVLRRDATPATLRVNSPGGGPTVGTNNRAILNDIMTTAAARYTWVLWGEVKNRADNIFDLDDGSGVIIHVAAGANSVSDGDYVAVKGSLDATTRTLTSQSITTYLDRP